jgi:hypothetical protein
MKVILIEKTILPDRVIKNVMMNTVSVPGTINDKLHTRTLIEIICNLILFI